MDKCLQVPEILRLVCNQVNHKNYRATAISIALTCRAFLEPGLDRAWRSIDSLEPIARCLPPGLLETKYRAESRPYQFSFTRGLFPEDLQRYRSFYARRIRKINLSCAPTFSTDAWQALQIATEWQPGALAPLVTSLSWVSTKSSSRKPFFPYFSLFLGPNLISLEFDLTSSVPIQVTSAQAIATRTAWTLKKLKIWSTENGVVERPFFARLFSSFSWPDLETLCLPDIPVDAVIPLSSLPRLTNLELHGLQSIPSLGTPTKNGIGLPSASHSVGDTMFPSLRSLSFGGTFGNGSVLEAVAGFFQRLPSENRVTSIECSLRHALSSSDCLKLVRTILNHCAAKNIQALSLYGVADENYSEGLELDRAQTVAPFQCIVPLLMCRGMKRLKVSLTQGWCLEPEELDKVASAWPQLQTLMLGAEFASSHMPRVDHTHILELLRRCPELTSLGLRFDATRVGNPPTPTPAEEQGLERGGDIAYAPDQMYGVPMAGSRLRTLSVCDSPIYSPVKVLAFLAHHCEFLKTVNYIRNTSNEGRVVPMSAYSNRWEVVAAVCSAS